MSWRTLPSAPSCRKAGSAIHGARTPTCFGSHPGTTIRCASRAEKPSTFAMKKPAISGQPLAAPCGGAAPYVTRHGFGYSVFEHVEDGIRSELTVFVALDAAVKFFSLKVSNHSGRARRLTATGYVEWVLGDVRAQIGDARDDRDRAEEWRVVCSQSVPQLSSRIGLHSSMSTSQLERSAETVPNFSVATARCAIQPPCTARTFPATSAPRSIPAPRSRLHWTWRTGQEREATFRLGAASNAEATGQLVQRFRGSAAARDALDAVLGYWRHTLTAVQVANARTSPSTCWPMAGSSIKRWAAACGRAVAITSRAVPTVSAINCRT